MRAPVLGPILQQLPHSTQRALKRGNDFLYDAQSDMSQTHEVRGRWKGSYRYFASDDLGDIPFHARLVCKDGVITGVCVETHSNGYDELKAELSGAQDGAVISFEKRNLLDGEEFKRVVHYDGKVATDAKSISGTWRHCDGSGSFTMTKMG